MHYIQANYRIVGLELAISRARCFHRVAGTRWYLTIEKQISLSRHFGVSHIRMKTGMRMGECTPRGA